MKVRVGTAAATAGQDTAAYHRVRRMWFVSAADPAHPEKFTAPAHTMDRRGGVPLPGVLVADTLDELRALLPAGLTRRDNVLVDPPAVVETWD